MNTFKYTGLVALIAGASAAGCATHTTTQTTWTASSASTAQRYGTVVEVRETVRRAQGNPAAGAAAGAVIGGAVSRRPVAGAAGGAAIGAGLSQGSSERRTYDVIVQFEDGSRRRFVYGGATPFHAGDPVVTTPGGGLARG